MQRQRVGFGTVVVFWRNDLHLDPVEGLERIMQRHDAGGLEAVVIGYQDLHGLGSGCNGL